MLTLEADSAVIPFPATDSGETSTTSYQITRFNALKHGILSRLVVLPHEDAGEFADLLVALVEEHQPTGATEAHLVAELAAIMWRQRRVLLAEGAEINAGLLAVTKRSFDSPIESAAPFERALSGKGTDVRELVTATPDEIAERQRQAALDRQATERAAAILGKGGANAYDRALRALPADSRDEWRGWVEDEEGYEATAEGLAEFIHDHLLPACIRTMKEIQHQPAIRAQTLGEGLPAHRLEKLNRYETHLDRKFERTLAMLVKLKEIRSSGGNNRLPTSPR